MKNLLVCPNKNLPEWQNLEATLGEDLAWKTFARNDGEYATPLEAVFQEFLQQRSNIAIPLLEAYINPEFKKKHSLIKFNNLDNFKLFLSQVLCSFCY